MKTIKTIFLLSLISLFSEQAWAKIAVVNSQYIFENANITKKINSEIKTVTKEAQEKLQAKEAELLKRKDDLLNKKEVLSSDAYSKQQAELKQEIINFRKEVKKTQRSLGLRNKQSMQEVAEKISKIVKDLAKKENYEIVLSKALLMYSSDSVDITKKVLKKLNEEE